MHHGIFSANVYHKIMQKIIFSVDAFLFVFNTNLIMNMVTAIDCGFIPKCLISSDDMHCGTFDVPCIINLIIIEF